MLKCFIWRTQIIKSHLQADVLTRLWFHNENDSLSAVDSGTRVPEDISEITIWIRSLSVSDRISERTNNCFMRRLFYISLPALFDLMTHDQPDIQNTFIILSGCYYNPLQIDNKSFQISWVISGLVYWILSFCIRLSDRFRLCTDIPSFVEEGVHYWAATWQNQYNVCAPGEYSDKPGPPPSLIRVFAVRMKKPWVLNYPLSTQRRLWSDWADAQADLSLRWAHTHFVGFVMSRLMCFVYYLLFHALFVHITLPLISVPKLCTELPLHHFLNFCIVLFP